MSARKGSTLKRIKRVIRYFRRLKMTKKVFEIIITITNLGLSGYEIYKKFFEKQIKQRKASQI